MQLKVKIALISGFCLLVILSLFMVFFKIDTFAIGHVFNWQGQQVVQVKKSKEEINLYQNKELLLRVQNRTFKSTINSLQEDHNFYYLSLDRFIFQQNEAQEKIWIYNQKMAIGEYILKALF